MPFDFDPAAHGLTLDENQTAALKAALGGEVQKFLDGEVSGLKSKNTELIGSNKAIKSELDKLKGQFDGLTYAPGQYLTLFFGQGAFGYGEGDPTKPVELERKPGGGNGGGAEVLWERKTFILQPAGFSWQGSENRNLSPTAAQYAAAANWKRVFDRKQVPFAAVISGTATP